MGLFKSLSGAREEQPAAWFPQCHVYYSAKGICVASVYGDITGGWSVDDEPMVLLSRDTDSCQIGEAVISSLRGSRGGLSTNEAELRWRSFPEFLGESSWEDVELHWDLILLSCESGRDVLSIYEMHRYEAGGGWGSVHGDSEFVCRLDPTEIGQLVFRIIAEGPPEVRPAPGPSHV